MPKKVTKTEYEWADELATTVAKETFKLLDAQGYKKGLTIQRHLLVNYVAKFTAMMVAQALHEEPGGAMNQREKAEYTATNFSEIKDLLQQSMAAAFEGAVADYTGKQTDFYCQIKRVPEPVNKYSC